MHRAPAVPGVVARVVCVSLLVIGGPLAAQDARSGVDTLPFRPGQWGALFRSDGSSYVSAGVLRFSAPARAWALDARFNGSFRSQESEGETASSDSRQSTVGLSLRAGRRAYSPLGRAVSAYRGVGLSAGLDRARSRYRSGDFLSSSGQWGWSAGAFAELGAEYLVTPRLGLGAVGSADLLYSERRGRPSDDASRFVDRGIGVSASLLAFVLSLYF